MKKRMLMAGSVLALGAWLVAQNAATPRPLAELTPAGAVLFGSAILLELQMWNENDCLERSVH